MTLLCKPILAKVRVQGTQNSIEIVALVDTGASLSIIDESLANYIGVEFPKKEKAYVKGICCEVEGLLGTIKILEVEGRYVGSSIVIVTRLSDEVKKTLRKLGASDSFILGLKNLIGFTIDETQRKLKWVGYIAF